MKDVCDLSAWINALSALSTFALRTLTKRGGGVSDSTSMKIFPNILSRCLDIEKSKKFLSDQMKVNDLQN